MISITALGLRLIPILLLLGTAPAQAQALKPGKLHPNVKVVGHPRQSYALYLPASYRSGKTHPILFGFSPGGNGRNVVERYLEGAERFGWIVVGSNNSRNGSNAVVERAADLLWKDAQARFKLDPKRLYATGMSGGASVAAWFAQSRDLPFAGTFLHARGEWSTIPRKKLPTFFYLLPGDLDFNLGESIRFLITARKNGATAHLEVQRGAHAWAPKESCIAAMRYAEIHYLCRHSKANASALPKLVKEELQHLESKASTPYFQLAMDRLSELAGSLKPKSAAANRVQRSLKKIQQREKARLEAEVAAFEKLAKDGLFDAQIGGRYPSIESLNAANRGRRRVIEEYPGTTAAHLALLSQLIAPSSLARASSLKPADEITQAYRKYAALVRSVDTDLASAARLLAKQKDSGRAITTLFHLHALEQLTRRTMRQSWVKRLRKHPAFAGLKALNLP